MLIRTAATVIVVSLLLAAFAARAEEDNNSTTVIGPRNKPLYDGANALIAGDAAEGVRQTKIGLKIAHGSYEETVGHANLCAGLIMLEQSETALEHCNWVLEKNPNHWRTYNNRALAYLKLKRYEESEADIKKGQELRPRSETLKEVKGMYLDEVEPVDEKITIKERRGGAD